MLEKYENILSRVRFSAPLSLAAGALGALAMAPASFWPALLISLSILYALLAFTRDKKRAFLIGWLYGFGYFVCGLSWIGNALLVDGNPYKWAWPLAVSGLPALLAFFTAFAALFTRFVNLRTPTGFAAFIALFFAAEWLRGHLFTGFPWNLYGYSWANIDEIAQMASIGNVYTLSALTLMWFAAPAFATLTPKRSIKIAVTALALLSFGGSYLFGLKRLESAQITAHEGINIKLVQPSIAQADKWDRRKMGSNFDALLRLSSYNPKHDPAGKTTYIVWPETAIIDGYLKDKGTFTAIKAMLNSYPEGASLFAGVLRRGVDGSYSNSLLLINSEGRISNIYNKHHLVPFGEYIPYQNYIPLAPVANFTGMNAGEGLQSLETEEGLFYSPLICYEIIFPGRSIPSTATRPDFIVNATNDAWYGQSAGPYQHFLMAKFRSIETGIPVIRVANTGLSGLFDPLGRNTVKSKLFETVTMNTQLPHKL